MNEGKLRAIKLLSVKSERPLMILVYQTRAGLRRRQKRPLEGQTLRDALRELSEVSRQ